MKWEHKRGPGMVSLALALCMCGAPDLIAGQTQSPPPAASQSTPQSSQSLPDDPGAETQSNGTTPQNQTQGQKPPSQPAQAPAGTGAAEAGPTAGGAGSKPAGMAIAPAKQHQVRSFLIKLGAIVGGAVAIGTVYALSRSSPSRPPGAK